MPCTNVKEWIYLLVVTWNDFQDILSENNQVKKI